MRKTVRGKKGEIASQMFIYILGIIVVALLLLLGFRAVQKLEDNKCTVQRTQFETDLAAAFDKDRDYGIVREEQFTLPCGAEEVCFVSRESANNNNINPGGADLSKYGVITASIASGDDTNVFIKTSNGYEGLERFSIAAPIDLPPDSPIKCFSGDPLKITFAGKGQTVEVKNAGSN